jgi:xanthine dehydrogenase molybdenum-binding subunit
MIQKATDSLEVELLVNGERVAVRVPPLTTLQGLLHDHLGRSEVKLGCAEGVCGACTVLVDGQPVASCLKLAAQAGGRRVTTVAGLEAVDDAYGAAFRALRDQFTARESFQCGYCAPGMAVSCAHFIASGTEASDAAVRRALSSNLCRCTGYEPIIEATLAAARREPVPAAREPRADVAQKVEGAVLYPTDARVDGMLVGRILWSEHACARIVRIDTQRARAVPGVVVVLTHVDVPGVNQGGETLFARDQKLLAVDHVNCRGDAVALVAARDDAAAREALRRIEVEYQPLPPVLDVLEALVPSAPQIGARGNVVAQITENEGDVDSGLRDADVVVEGEYRCDINDHACMELEGGIARMEGDQLVLTITSLTPHAARASIATALGIAGERITIETPRMGGSFGKYLAPSVETHLALLCYQTGAPVRLVLDRTETLARRAKRHSFWGRYRLGVGRDGRFLALDADVIADAGPYASMTPMAISMFADEVAGAYHIPNVRVRARGVLTNNLLTSPMRGFGSQQITFGIESIVEKAAHALGIDPGELRRKNFVSTRKDGQGRAVPNPKIMLGTTLDRVNERLGPRPSARPGVRVGRGVASVQCKYGFPYGMVDRFIVRVAVDAGGRFRVESDVPDSGTGIVAGAARLVARELGLTETPEAVLATAMIADPSGHTWATGRSPSPVRRWLFAMAEALQGFQLAKAIAMTKGLPPSTETRLLETFASPLNAATRLANSLKSWLFPLAIDSYLPRTGSSRGMLMVGGAALDAAEQLRSRAIGIAAELLSVPAADLSVDGRGVARPDGAGAITWAQLAAHEGGSFSAVGAATIPSGDLLDRRSGNQVGPIDRMIASHGCDLAVDEQTGRVTILRYVACQDVGRAINPEMVRGQLLGSIAMGVGQALLEKVFRAKGAVQNPLLHDYLVPTSLDVPVAPIIEILESGDGFGPHGAKGCGEASAVAAPITIANALYDALGAQPTCIPATPEDLVALLGRDGR